jgi:nitrilase
MEPVKVAAAQATPVLLDRDATIGKVVALTEQAAAQGARLVVFPEAFVPGYPDWAWRTRPWDAHASAMYDRLLDQAVVIGSAATEVLAETARRLGIWLSVGADERDDGGATLYNSLLHFAPDGTLAARHRKLMPTGGERLVWGTGDGSTLDVIDTGFGRLGGLTCWENYMPLARFHLYAQGVDVWIAPTLAPGDGWIATMRHLARENRMFVLGVNPVQHADQLPAGFPGRDRLLPPGFLAENGPWLEEGNTVIVAPDGTVIAGPIRQREETLIADLDLRDVTIQRRHLDPVGHYNRPDIFQLHVDTTPRLPVIETSRDSEPENASPAGSAGPVSEPIGGPDEHRTSDAAKRARARRPRWRAGGPGVGGSPPARPRGAGRRGGREPAQL